MAGIMNKTARQFNLKCACKKTGHKVVVRLAPGFNIVKDAHWGYFRKGNHTDPYVKELKKAGHIDYGDEWDDMELERDGDVVSKSKIAANPKTPISEGK